MRKTKRPVTVYEDVFVACDGKQFDSEKECLEYEEDFCKRSKTLKEKEVALKLSDFEWPITFIWEYLEDESNLTWYSLKNEEDLKILTEYLKVVEEVDIEVDPEIAFPCKVCVLIPYPGYSDLAYCVTLDDAIASAKRHLNILTEMKGE